MHLALKPENVDTRNLIVESARLKKPHFFEFTVFIDTTYTNTVCFMYE